MPITAVSPRIPAGHFIPLATSRYDAAPPIVRAIVMQVILMIHLLIASSVLSLHTGLVLISNIATSILCQSYKIQHVIPVGVGQSEAKNNEKMQCGGMRKCVGSTTN